MNNQGLEKEIREEILRFIDDRQSLMLSSLDQDGVPYASYAPFAVGDNCLFILISEIAVHARNLQQHPQASVLIIEDENSATELFARLRVQFRVHAELISPDSIDWEQGIRCLHERHGERIKSLSQLGDFKLFRLQPEGGRYVKGFGKAYRIEGGTLSGERLSQLRGGHVKRDATKN